MARVTEISQIYDRKLKALRDPQKWENTLRRTSNFWRLSFCEAMLLTEQNPNATVCGTLQQWNKCGRYVRRGEKSVAVFKDRTDTQLTYLFDISQTYGAAFNPKWVMSERIADGIVGKFNAENDEKVNSLEEFLIKDLDKNIDLVYNYDSKLTKTIENDPRVLRLISESAKCICMTRCGIDREYDFSVTEKLGSDLSIIAMGNAAAVLAREVLRDVDRTIRRKEYEQYEADVCGRHLRYPLRREGRSEISEIRELRQSADVTDSEESVRPDERNGQNGVGNDQHKRSLPDDMGGNSGESGAEQSADGGNAEKENDTQRELRSEGGAAHSDRNAVAERGLGYNTSVRELVVGGDLEQGYADGDSEYQSEYDDELIEEEYDEAESDEDSAFFVSDGEQLSFFTDEPSEDTNGLFIGEYNRLALLEEEILRGTGSVDGKFRVQKYYLNEAPSRKELAAFMKKEYGIGGHSGNGDVDFIDHDSKGIRIRVKDVLAPDGISTARFGWSEVAQFTAELIDSGEYITQAEIDERIERAKKTLKNYRPSNQFDTYQIEYAKTVLREYGFLAENESDLTESLPAEIEEKVAEIMAKYGNSDKFFVNLEPEHVTDVYYNPDSSEGGQLVYNRFDFDDIDEALLSSDPASYIDSASEVSLVDITDTEFVGYAEGFLNNSGSVSESYIFVSDSPSRITELKNFIEISQEFDSAIRDHRIIYLEVAKQRLTLCKKYVIIQIVKCYKILICIGGFIVISISSKDLIDRINCECLLHKNTQFDYEAYKCCWYESYTSKKVYNFWGKSTGFKWVDEKYNTSRNSLQEANEFFKSLTLPSGLTYSYVDVIHSDETRSEPVREYDRARKQFDRKYIIHISKSYCDSIVNNVISNKLVYFREVSSSMLSSANSFKDRLKKDHSDIIEEIATTFDLGYTTIDREGVNVYSDYGETLESVHIKALTNK